MSVAVHGDLVYVVNAENGGSVQGYRIVFGFLIPIIRSNRALGLDPTATPQFTNTPGQVAFTPDGSQLVVTTKANGNDIDVFQVRRDGRLSSAPVVNTEPGTVPFAVTFDQAGDLVVSEAGTNALATFSLSPIGVATEIDEVATGQGATCWVAAVNGNFYASNAGSATVSDFQDRNRRAAHARRASPQRTRAPLTPPGPQTATSSTCKPGRSGIVDEFRWRRTARLTAIGSVTVAGAAGGEGIVAF